MRVCQKCKSSRVHQSRTRSAVEQAVVKLGLQYFRCHDCQWRGKGLPQPVSQVASIADRDRFIKILFGSMGLLVLLVLFLA